jgi:hypothetical protein
MIDEVTLAQINGQYVCPANAGREWQTAFEYGFDMSLVESMLSMTPEERLDAHQRALDTILVLRGAKQQSNATE